MRPSGRCPQRCGQHLRAAAQERSRW